MYLLETLLDVNHQQYLDRLREAERQRLLRIIEGPRSSSKMYRKSVGWLGTQLVKWGTKLQSSQNPDTGCQEASLKMSMTAH
jgi:hypothetical protein